MASQLLSAPTKKNKKNINPYFYLKGNQKRPTCSRCQEAGITCVYSSKRRKPGPPKGVRRKRRSPQAGPDVLPDPAQMMDELNSGIFPDQGIDSTPANIDFLSESGFPDAEAFLGLNFSTVPSTEGAELRDIPGTNIGSHDLQFGPMEELDLSVSVVLFQIGAYGLT